jgi:hypothetical protein
MNESSLKPLNHPKPIFGIMPSACFCAGAGLYWHGGVVFMDNIAGWAAAMGTMRGEVGWWQHDYELFGAKLLWVLGLVFSVTGLLRVERPRWPAIVGLVLCMLPLALILFSLAFAAIHPE